MSVDFNQFLSNQDKIKILEKRIKELATEAYKLKVNHDVYKVVGDDQSAAVCLKSMETIKVAIALHKTELFKLPSGHLEEQDRPLEIEEESDTDNQDVI